MSRRKPNRRKPDVLTTPTVLWTLPQTALRLRVSSPTVRRLHQHNDLPGAVVAGQLRFSASDVERWCAERSWDHPKPPIRARDVAANCRKAA